LVSSDSAIIYLNNRLIKDRKQLDILGDDLEKKSSEMNKLSSLLDSIENKTTAEYDKAKEVKKKKKKKKKKMGGVFFLKII
jgi:hypothetical protein